MLQTPEVAAARIQIWFRKHPSVAETDKNIALLTNYIRDYFSISGEAIIDEAYLDLAYRNIGGTMQHIVGPEVQAQIEQANQQAQALLTQKQALEAEAERERKRIEHEQFLEQRQRNRRPGPASAYEGMENRASEEARARQAVRDQAANNALYAEFQREIRTVNTHIVVMTDGSGRIQWGKTESARQAMRENLKRRYPQFANEVE